MKYKKRKHKKKLLLQHKLKAIMNTPNSMKELRKKENGNKEKKFMY